MLMLPVKRLFIPIVKRVIFLIIFVCVLKLAGHTNKGWPRKVLQSNNSLQAKINSAVTNVNAFLVDRLAISQNTAPKDRAVLGLLAP